MYMTDRSERGLLNRSTARYFYKRLEASLHKPTGNLLENLFLKNVYLINF
jgi:predicted transcriptional regulator